MRLDSFAEKSRWSTKFNKNNNNYGFSDLTVDYTTVLEIVQGFYSDTRPMVFTSTPELKKEN